MRTVFFDLDDTIYDRSVPFVKAFDEFFDHKYDVNTAQTGYTECSERGQEVFADSQSGKITMEEMYIYRYTKGMHDIGIEISAADALRFQKLYKKYQGMLDMTSTMEEILTRSKQHFDRVAVLTNGPGEHQRMKARSLGLERWVRDEWIIISGEAGVIKPKPGIFRYAEKKLDTDPEDTWIIGDSYDSDIAGAAAVGWHSIWLNKKRISVPEGQPAPDHIVYSEEELAELIRSI